MASPNSKLTAQGQVSVPAEIRRKLGIGPGSVLEWHADGDQVVVRRAGRHTSEEIHHALFPKAPKARTLADLKDSIRREVRRRRGRS